MDSLYSVLLVAPVLLFSVIAHEIAHGYAALRQGDPTAYELGRLTWNPLKHVDPFMTILMPALLWIASGGRFMLGGAKPVPVNPRNYRHYKRGDIIVSLAGVATNFVVALACTLLIVLLGLVGGAIPALAHVLGVIQLALRVGIWINLGLIAFNLLPIPPLDGSHVMKYLLPPSLSLRYQQVGFLGIAVVLLLLYAGGGLLEWWLTPAAIAADFLLRLVHRWFLPTSWTP